MNIVVSTKQTKLKLKSGNKTSQHKSHKSATLYEGEHKSHVNIYDTNNSKMDQDKVEVNPQSTSFINSEFQASQNFHHNRNYKFNSKQTTSSQNRNILLQDGMGMGPTTVYSNHFPGYIPYKQYTNNTSNYLPKDNNHFQEDVKFHDKRAYQQQVNGQNYQSMNSKDLQKIDTQASNSNNHPPLFQSPVYDRQQSSKIIEEISSAEPETQQFQLHDQMPSNGRNNALGPSGTATQNQDFMVPVGSLESILFLAQLINQNHQVNIRIPDTIIAGRHSETKLITNEYRPLSSHNQHTNSKKTFQKIPKGANNNLNLYSIDLPSTQIEEQLCSWLQLNMTKNKKAFVPISIKKIKNRNQNGQKVDTSLDFFTSAALNNFNNGFKQIRANQHFGTNSSDFFLMQQYLPQKEEYPQIFRGLWRKNGGFKFYKLTSYFPYNGHKDLIRMASSNTTSNNPLQQSEESKDQYTNLKFMTFDILTDLYDQVCKIDNDKLHQQLIQSNVLRNSEVNYTKNAKLDLGSRRNLQHMLLNHKIESQFNISHQFEVLDKDPKKFSIQKVKSRDSNTLKLVEQITSQLNELVKLLNTHLLKSEGLELLRLTADFLEDYNEENMYFLQIKSYQVDDLPVIKEKQPSFENIMLVNQRHTQSMAEVDKKHKFQCSGDYCYIQDMTYVPKHLAPIVSKLQNHDYLKIPKRTIILERENIKDNFRAYSKGESLFQTMNEQEILLRKSLKSNDQLEVCPSCFHVYQFLQKTYYDSQGPSHEFTGHLHEQLTAEDYQLLMRQSHAMHQQQQFQQFQNKHRSLSYGQNLPSIIDKQALIKQYQQFINGEEIKEDYAEENKDSKEYEYPQNQILESDMPEDHDDNDLERQELEDYDQEEQEPYKQVQVELTMASRDNTFQNENTTQSKFNIGMEENSNSPDFNDRSDFKLPSDLQSIQQYKQSHLSGANQNASSSLYQHQRFNSNMTPQSYQQNSDQLSQQQQVHHYRNNSSRDSRQRSQTLEQSQYNTPYLHKRQSSQKSNSKLAQEFQETEFNPVQKFNIKPRESRKLKQRGTSEFGGGDSMISNGSNKNIKQETFSVAQIIARIKKQNSSLRNSAKKQEVMLSLQKSQTQQSNTSIVQTPTAIEKKVSLPALIKKKSTIKEIKMQQTPDQLNQSLASFTTSKKLQNNRTHQLIQTQQSVTSLSSLKQRQVNPLKSRNIDIQTGDSLAYFSMKPPLNPTSSAAKQQPSLTKEIQTQVASQTESQNHQYLDTQNQKKELTSQNSLQSFSNASMNKQATEKRKSNQSNQNETKLPLITNNEFSPVNSLRDIKHQDSSELILKVPIDNITQTLNGGTTKNQQDSTGIRQSNNSSTKNNKSKNRMRSWSVQGAYKVENKIVNGVTVAIPVLVNNNMIKEHNLINNSEKETDNQILAPGNIVQENKITKVLADDIEAPLTKTNRQIRIGSSYSKQLQERVKSVTSNKDDTSNMNSHEYKSLASENKSRLTQLKELEFQEEDEEQQQYQPPPLEMPKEMITSNQTNFIPDVIDPKSPPQLKFLEGSPLLTQPRVMDSRVSQQTKKDSFFDGILGQSQSQEDEYLVDYIVSNEEGDMSSSLMNSNPQLMSLVQQNANQVNGRNTLLLLGEQRSIPRNMSIYMVGPNGVVGLGGGLSTIPAGNNSENNKQFLQNASLEKVIEDASQ